MLRWILRKQSLRFSGKRFSSTTRPANEIEIFIDGKPVMIEQGSSLIQACEKAGINIPRFCYHERLSVAGNCRMCLVEVEKVPKPVASCAYPVTSGMRVKTQTPMVHKAREGVMEFLLSNHPLDCPICDQGGECDLQDQSVRYGSDRGRFHEFEGKRAVEDKDFGPLIKTTMTRCIHCTRCVRFANDVAGSYELGTSGRGNDMQIGTYVEKIIDSELSGNIIDLCPVGALTSKPYEFKSRPWELKKTESIDVLDATGSHIRVDSRGSEVMRILPRLNENINEEWISDKTRFAYDGLKRQRLLSPMIKTNGKFEKVSWNQALQYCSQKMKDVPAEYIGAVAGSLIDAECLAATKELLVRMGSSNFYLDNCGYQQSADFRSNYIFNSHISGIERSDVILMVGCNPRKEASVLNARIRKAWLHHGTSIGLIGEPVDLRYEYEHIGNNIQTFVDIIERKTSFSKKLEKASNPLVIIGSGIAEHVDAQSIFALLSKLVSTIPNFLSDTWNGVNILQRSASTTAALDLGFFPSNRTKAMKECKVLYLLGADDFDRSSFAEDVFVIYQGHHGDLGAQNADVVLPGAAYTEKSATYVNTEGRTQMTRAAVQPPGLARDDWTIVRALSEYLNCALPFDDIYGLRERMSEVSPSFRKYGLVENCSSSLVGIKSLETGVYSNSGAPFKESIKDFYFTDPISRASITMAKCSRAFSK